MLSRRLITFKSSTRNLSSWRTRVLEKQKMKMNEENNKKITKELSNIEETIRLFSNMVFMIGIGVLLKPIR
jgi:hypothetical protein